MRRELCRENLNRIAGIFDPEGLSELKQSLCEESAREERLAIALRSGIEQGGASGETSPREQCSFQAE
jgi:hypothetical protein